MLLTGVAAQSPNPVLDRCRDSQSAFDTSNAALRKVANDDHHAGFFHKPSLNGIRRKLPLLRNFHHCKHFLVHSRRSQNLTNGILRLISHSFLLKIVQHYISWPVRCPSRPVSAAHLRSYVLWISTAGCLCGRFGHSWINDPYITPSETSSSCRA